MNTALNKQHIVISASTTLVALASELTAAAAAAAAARASVTLLKGGGFEAEVDAVLEQIAAGLGDEYVHTGGVTGAIQNCRKGDGVLTVAGGAARVVIEMHDSGDRRVWNDYLDEAERNREAAASVGVVRSVAQNQGQTIQLLGSRRVVVAFDPTCDDPGLLRTVVQLMRASAITASSRRDVEGLETAEENLHAALGLVERINTIRKTAGSIRKGADTIDRECNTVQKGVQRHLSQALDALHGVALEAADLAAAASDEDRPATGVA